MNRYINDMWIGLQQSLQVLRQYSACTGLAQTRGDDVHDSTSSEHSPATKMMTITMTTIRKLIKGITTMILSTAQINLENVISTIC